MTRPRAGFTLIEVMLAVTILGIVSTALYGTFSRTLRSRALAEDRAEIVRTGRSALARLTDELAAAFYPRRPGEGTREGAIFRSLPGGTVEAPLQSLAFSALAARPSGLRGHDAAHQVITYLFAEERDGMQRGRAMDMDDDVVDLFAGFDPVRPLPRHLAAHRLLRREAVVLARRELAAETATLFLDNVASLAFTFHDGTEWRDTWDSEEHPSQPLPRAVGVDLALYDAQGRVHHFATAVDLPLARRGARREAS
jgi:prepilin-type N-terminal cleavage/methylation domain-containing protein